ncbi:MAG: YdiU family protein [Pelistega sp.]|nr:YdiU family protein [Pelistega sp.]
MAKNFQELKVGNGFAESLPRDFYTFLPMQGLHEPQLVHINKEVAASLAIEPELYRSPEFLAVMAGQQDLPGGKTLASVYSGHQFGVWAGQLGDGRAHLLGDILGAATDSPSRWEIQLKGAGLTPYSRMGDGRAVLRSSLREYLCSAAMQGLGIPTTLALSIVTSEDRVRRETMETAAIISRVAPSFVRFGSFQHWQAHNRPDLMESLLHYVVDNFYPQINQSLGSSKRSSGATDTNKVPSNTEGASALASESEISLEEKTVAFLHEVVRRTARLMADWQTVGFVHGVMNTDNMSILGLTLDYGPFAFIDRFKMDYVVNHSDGEGRYAWHRQPSVGLWNLYQLANSLALLVQEKDRLKAVLDTYEYEFSQAFKGKMLAKLGFAQWGAQEAELLDLWWDLLQRQHADFTLAFRNLSKAWREPADFIALFHRPEKAEEWLSEYHQYVQSPEQLSRLSNEARERQMNQANPLYILRTWIAQEAIEQVQAGDKQYLDRLMQVLANPYIEHQGCEAWASLPPLWSDDLHLSCSS